MKTIAFTILVLATICITSCNPWKLPGLREEARRQDERVSRETDEAIRTTPVLQDLARLCTEEIPRPRDFVESRKYADFNDKKFLGYVYDSALDYSSVRAFYRGFFLQHGWRLAGEKEGWGPSQMEFRNDKYRVTIYDKGARDGAYDVVCGID